MSRERAAVVTRRPAPPPERAESPPGPSATGRQVSGPKSPTGGRIGGEKAGEEQQQQEEEAQEFVTSLERLELSCQTSRRKVKATSERLISQIREHEQRLLEEIDDHRQTELKKVPVDHAVLRELTEQFKNIEQLNRENDTGQSSTSAPDDCHSENLIVNNGTTHVGFSLTTEDSTGRLVTTPERDLCSKGGVVLGDNAGAFTHGMLGCLSNYDVPEIRSVIFVPIRCNTSFGTVQAEGASPALESNRQSWSVSLLGTNSLSSDQLSLSTERTCSLQRTHSLRMSRSQTRRYGTYPADKLGAPPSFEAAGGDGENGRLRRHHSMKIQKDLYHLSAHNAWSQLTSRRAISSSPTRDVAPELFTLLWELTDVGSAPNRFNTPTDVVFLPNGDLAVTDRGNERVSVINWKRGTIVRNIGQGKIRPQRLAVTRDGHLAVTDLKSNCVKIFSLDGRSVSSWGRKRFKSTFQSPCGLAINSRGQYVVSDMERQSVSLHQSDGKQLQLLGSQTEFHSPAYVATAGNDQVVVADNWTNTVKVYRPDGELLFQLNDQTESSRLDYPNGVCVDANGDVFVAGWGKHRISKFNSTGKFVHHLLTRDDGIHYPAGIATRGALIAETEYSDSHSAVRLFQMSKPSV